MSKVTMERLERLIKTKEYIRLGQKTTICFITMTNGFEIIGKSACVDPANFDKAVGEFWALHDAMDKLAQLEGYRLQWELKTQEDAPETEKPKTCCSDPANYRTRKIGTSDPQKSWDLAYCAQCGDVIPTRELP
jgi:hypothetical protein